MPDNNNPFADLIPRDTPKPGRRVRNGVTRMQDGGENPFADLVPEAVEGEQTPTIGRKGNKSPGSRMQSDLRSTFNQGALLNFSDEAAAGIGALRDYFMGGELPLGEAYEQNLAAERSQLEATREARPYLAPATEIAGAVSTAFVPGAGAVRGYRVAQAAPRAVKWVMTGKGLVPISLRGSASGTALGAVAGAGAGETGEDRLEGAEEGAATGAGVGLVAPGLARTAAGGYRLVRAGANAIAAPARSLARPTRFAATKVAEAAKRDQMSMPRMGNRLAEAQRRNPEAVLADVGGVNTQALLRAAKNVPSDARQGLTRNLRRRLEGTRGRLTGMIGRAFGDPATFHQSVADIALARKQNAAPLFKAAFATGTPWTRELQAILQRPAMRRLVADAEQDAANRGEQFKSIFAKINADGSVQFTRVPDTEALHRIKVQIDTVMNAIRKNQPTSLGNMDLRTLKILKDQFLGAIKNDPYKKALREFSGDSAFVNALDEGYEAFAKEPEEIAAAISRLAPGEAAMYRLGFGRALAEKMRPGVVGANRAERMMSPEIMDRVQRVFRDPRERKEFLEALQMERRMFKTNNEVVGNSATHERMVEGQEAGVDAENVQTALDTGSKLARGDLLGAFVKLLGRAKNTATGLRPETADQIIKLLTTKDPVEVARAQRLVQRELTRIGNRARTPRRIEQGITTGGFTLINRQQSGQ